MAAGDQLIFHSWKRSPLFANATIAPGQPRLSGKLSLELRDDNGGAVVRGDAPFTFMAAADVAGLTARAIIRTAPPPFARDAETTKMVHVDFADEDLPWRYAPEANSSQRIRPWLVLLVGTSQELKIEGNLVNVQDSVLQAYELSAAAPANVFPSYLWAHVQETAGVKHSRLVSPVRLEGQHEYVAALVPAFNAQGREMWTLERPMGGNIIVHPDFGESNNLLCLHSWRFWTAEQGDFETLAARLHIPKAGSVGKARLHYPRLVMVGEQEVRPAFDVGGAIMSLQPDLGRVKPVEMNDGQLLDALAALLNDEQYREELLGLMPPGVVNPKDLTLDAKRAVLTALAKPVQALIAIANQDLDVLNENLPDTFDPPRKMIPMPPYGRPWLPDPDAITNGWADTLNDDPRFRGLAGLGTWMGVEGQEALMDAAVQQAGALRDAGQVIANLAMGIWAAGRLWDRRLPEDQNEQLSIFGPIMARMLTTEGGTVLNRITSGTSPLTAALFSGAAQRVLRDRTAHTRHTKGVNRSQMLDIANEVEPLPGPAPVGLPHLDAIAERVGLPPLDKFLGLDQDVLREIRDQLDALVQSYVEKFQEQGEALGHELAAELFQEYVSLFQNLLTNFNLPCEAGMDLMVEMAHELGLPASVGLSIDDFVMFIEECLQSREARRQLEAALLLSVMRCMGLDRCREFTRQLEVPDPDAFCDDLLRNLPPPPRQEQKPINLGGLHTAVAAALDPRAPDAPARVRVSATIHGLDLSRLVRPEFPIGLDFPTWELLRQYDKEWLLPGVNGLEKDSITALQTNPSFVDAFMVGINTQFMNEMVWRDLAVARDCTPLRMFWGQVDYKKQSRQPDIEPLREWAKAPDKDIGNLAHQTITPGDGNNTGSRLVIVFRSDLFRRYPTTLVYLFKPQAAGDLNDQLKEAPDLGPEEAAKSSSERRYYGPTFVGTLTPDVTFFAFDIRPETLDDYWLVLDEPPTELRFRSDKPLAEINTAHSAVYAASTLDEPTRVAISGAWLEDQARNP